MIYLLETELSNQKPLFIALTEIYGINKSNSINFCKKLGFSSNFKVSDLSLKQKSKLIRLINESNIIINSDLRKLKTLTNKKLINIKLYRGIRKINGFPVRGQRTRSNAKTAKKLNKK